MTGLDFSPLSDDQLIDLIRAALRETVARGGGVSAAARDAMLDESERAKIAEHAGANAAAVLRAQERERVAREAAERVRAQHAAQTAAAAQARAREAADKAREAALAAAEASRTWLRRAASLVGQEPASISLILADTQYGRRVLINNGSDRFQRDHLSDWNKSTGKISVSRALLRAKPDLAAFSAEFEALHAGKSIFVDGSKQDWTTR